MTGHENLHDEVASLRKELADSYGAAIQIVFRLTLELVDDPQRRKEIGAALEKASQAAHGAGSDAKYEILRTAAGLIDRWASENVEDLRGPSLLGD